jgi:hypothetical protein
MRLHFYIYSTTEQPTIYWRRDTSIQYCMEDESLLYDYYCVSEWTCRPSAVRCRFGTSRFVESFVR